MRKVPRPVVLLLKAAVTVLAVWLVLGRIDDFSAIAEAARGAHWGWLFLCLLMQYAMAMLNALRWRELVPVAGAGLRKYLYYVFVGHFLSLFLPSAALAEGARTWAFGRKYGDMQRNFAAALFARGSGLAVQAVIVLAFVTWSWEDIRSLEAWGALRFDPAPVVAGAAVLGSATAIGLYFWREKILYFAGILIGYARNLRLFARVLALSTVIQVCAMVGTYALFRSVTPEIQFWHVAVIPIVVQLILLVPVSFGGVGVREYLNILFYTGLAGIAAEITLTASLLAYIYWGIMAGTGAAWMALRRRGVLNSQNPHNFTDGTT